MEPSAWPSRLALATLCVAGIIEFSAEAEARKPARPTTPPEPPSCEESQPKFVLFLDQYPKGRFYLAVLPCLAGNEVNTVEPRELVLDMPRAGRQQFQVANGDVFFDGDTRRIVFGGRTGPNAYWGIYEGVLDVSRGSITEIEALVTTPLIREEDPRFSSDGQWIVYKRSGEIWRLYVDSPASVPELFHREEGCELWAPSMFANAVSYVRRCGADPDDDRIVYHLEGRGPEVLPSEGHGPDRFAVFTGAGELVYSHVDRTVNEASLWMYVPGADPFPLHSETSSDDDSYAEREANEYIAFSGWGETGYDLYMYSRSQRSAVQLTAGINVLGPILFD